MSFCMFFMQNKFKMQSLTLSEGSSELLLKINLKLEGGRVWLGSEYEDGSRIITITAAIAPQTQKYESTISTSFEK